MVVVQRVDIFKRFSEYSKNLVVGRHWWTYQLKSGVWKVLVKQLFDCISSYQGIQHIQHEWMDIVL